VYSDGGTWYSEAYFSLGLKHRLHSSLRKSIIERAMEYVKRIERKILMISILAGGGGRN
jgi:hypothetical protein